MSGVPKSLSFPIVGRPFTASDVSDDFAQWLYANWRRAEHDTTPHWFAIRLCIAREADLPESLRARLPERVATTIEAATPVHVTARGDRASALLGSIAGGAYLDLEPGAAHVRAWGVAEPSSPGRWPLLVALHEVVRASGLLPLHGAAAIRPNDTGATAFLGPSGVGKSTTLLGLARAGWAPVCEDFAWLDPDTLRLYAWDHGVRLLPDAIARLGHLTAHALPRDVRPKRLVTYSEIAERYGVRRHASTQLQRLVRLTRGDGPSRWVPLPRVAAVPVLWEAIGLPLTTPAQRLVARWIARLVDDVELCTLRLGETPVPPAEAP